MQRVGYTLLTGSSGFLGKHIVDFMGQGNVATLSRNYGTYRLDLKNTVPEFVERFDIIVHAAGKAHSVPRNDAEKREFFDTNVTGTLNLLKGLESFALPRAFVFISSVAVYGIEKGLSINEDTPLLATDAYGKSKIDAEKVVKDWCDKNNVICAILRVPLIAGAYPPGNLGAMLRGLKNGYYFNVAGGKARKSMVLANDVAKIIQVVANHGGTFNLTDGHHPTFEELSFLMAEQLGLSKPHNIPITIAKILACFGDIIGAKAPINSNKLHKITNDLIFDDTKARTILGWNPLPILSYLRIE